MAASAAARSVVEVYTAHAAPNFLHPYQGAVPEFSHSTAFAVPGRLLLTNAHCVAFATHVQVKRRDQDVRFAAEVVCIGYECDLALIAVADDSFWRGHGPPIRFSGDCLPSPGAAVTVLGFGQGGDNLCTTKGVVSRIDVQPYPWARGRGYQFIQLPVIQIDAAINPGNSGGPALAGDPQQPVAGVPAGRAAAADEAAGGGGDQDEAGAEALGVAFMGLQEAQSIGFIIPAKVALHFLEDFRLHGAFTHFGYPPFQWQCLETQDMRSYFQAEGQGGVRVSAVDPNVASGLQADDVIVELFGERVGHDGKVAVPVGLGSSERVSLWILFCDKFTGTPCDCKVLRNGEAIRLTFNLQPAAPLVPMDPTVPNEFLVVAGLVLQPLTAGYLADAEAWGSYQAQHAFRGMWDTATDGRQVVIVTGVLSHEVNAGMPMPREDALQRVNNKLVRSLCHAAELVDGCSEEWLVLSFSSRSVLAVRTDAARRATKELVERHGLQADRYLEPITSKL